MSEDTGTETVDTTTETSENTGSSPYAEQLQSMENRLTQQITEQFDQRFPNPEPEPFINQLYGENNFEDLTDEEADALYADENTEVSPEQLVQAMIESETGPLREALAAREEAEAFAQIDRLIEKYPDLESNPEIRDAVVDMVDEFVQRTGNEQAKLDPFLIETAYKAAKADAAAANEVPAESAALGEASLETWAGPSQQGDTNPDDDIRKAIMSHSVGGDPF